MFSSELIWVVSVKECSTFKNYKIMFIYTEYYFIIIYTTDLIIMKIWISFENLRSSNSVNYFWLLEIVQFNTGLWILGIVNVVKHWNTILNISVDKNTIRLWTRLKLKIFLNVINVLSFFLRMNIFFASCTSNYSHIQTMRHCVSLNLST